MEVLAQADRFAKAELYPLAQKMDDGEWWPDAAFPKIGATGYVGITAPEQYGGSGMDVFTSGLILQAFSRWNHALGLSWVAHENLCLHNLLRNANAEDKDKDLAGPVQGPGDWCPGADGAGWGVGCLGLDAHDGAPRGKPLCAQWPQALHH